MNAFVARFWVSLIGVVFLLSFLAFHGPARTGDRGFRGKRHSAQSALWTNLGMLVGLTTCTACTLVNGLELLRSRRRARTKHLNGDPGLTPATKPPRASSTLPANVFFISRRVREELAQTVPHELLQEALRRHATSDRLHASVSIVRFVLAMIVGIPLFAVLGTSFPGSTGNLLGFAAFFAIWYLAYRVAHELVTLRVHRDLARNVRSYLNERGLTLCMECGYDLRGLITTRCPECGAPSKVST